MDSNFIDFIVLWVDCNDPVWQNKRAIFSPDENITDVSAARYRDWDLLRYWFRGVERFAPWVRKIHFVTDDQIPEWLNVDNPRLNCVSHSDYMPQEALPVFNSSAIEIGLHKIPDLSEHFVFFNDDMFLINEITPEYYFKNDLSVDTPGLAKYNQNPGNGVFANILLNDLEYVRTKYTMSRVYKDFFTWFNPSYGKTFVRSIRHMFHKQIPGFVIPHLSVPYNKREWSRIWEVAGDILNDTQYHRFRCKSDFSHFVFRFCRLCEGSFAPRKTLGEYISLCDWKSVECAKRIIESQTVPEICLNDCWQEDDMSVAKAVLQAAFDQILPDECTFEK